MLPQERDYIRALALKALSYVEQGLEEGNHLEVIPQMEKLIGRSSLCSVLVQLAELLASLPDNDAHLQGTQAMLEPKDMVLVNHFIAKVRATHDE